MFKASVTQDLACPPETLWALVRDFGDTSWIPGGENAEVEGSGPGMVRTFGGGDGPPIREYLESVEESTRTLRYSIPENIPFPVTGYLATMRVLDGAAGGCRLEWTCEGEPDGVPEAEAVATIEGMYQVMIGWIRDKLAAS